MRKFIFVSSLYSTLSAHIWFMLLSTNTCMLIRLKRRRKECFLPTADLMQLQNTYKGFLFNALHCSQPRGNVFILCSLTPSLAIVIHLPVGCVLEKHLSLGFSTEVRTSVHLHCKPQGRGAMLDKAEMKLCLEKGMDNERLSFFMNF